MSNNYSRHLWIGVMLLVLWAPTAALAVAKHPLEPPDLSSPKATLNTFLTTGDLLYSVLRDEYWYTPSRAVVDRLSDFDDELQRMLDLSGIPPAARYQLGKDGIFYLYEVLSRIELPAEADIPDVAASANAGEDLEAGHKTVSWTIPHTEITLVRVAEGPRAGEFLFSSRTVARAKEFYEKTRTLSYLRDVPLKNYVEMRPYLSMANWIIPPNTIEGFPDWLKRSVHQQAVWKWVALLILIALTTAVILVIHRLSRRGLSGHSAAAYLRRLITPLALLLLMPLVLNLANVQLTLTGWVSGGIGLVAEAVTYFGLAWVIWTVSMAVSEGIIASPRIPDQSLNAHLLRLVARTIGILGVIAIIIYVSHQLGVPLYGLVTGLGVGGLAVALAVRPSLENVIGGLILFLDKPVRVGEYCCFGEENGTVEEIGLRSTRLRKLDDTLVSIPNADLSQLHLTNYTRRQRNLYKTTLGLRYETSAEQLRYVLIKLREMLLGHPKVSEDTLHVRFDGFGAYSLDVEVFTYIRTRDWLTYRAIREDINLRIMDIVLEAGTGFAFPSQTVYLGRDSGLDAERGRETETQVQEWRSKGQLPFPEFDKGIRGEKEDVLDYPPEGSPDFKPRIV
jgi:MscS family membrane protein